ncbi:MAG: c-type cytochrome domain-containing protein, partial [Actinomycetota bacterium]
GWSAESYQSVMASGNSGPAVIPGDAENSLLGQWLLGTGTGGFMPPSGSLPTTEVDAILAWIRQGAPDN